MSYSFISTVINTIIIIWFKYKVHDILTTVYKQWINCKVICKYFISVYLL